MRRIKMTSKIIAYITFTLYLLSGCTTKLAPEYDKEIVSSLSGNSEKVLTLFSSVSNGSKSADFNKREKTYDELIGSFEALKIKSESRPIPSNTVIDKANKYLSERNIATIPMSAPSAGALNTITTQLKAMKARDNSQNMSATMIETFKNPVITALDQAITYESFLER